ncbi:hypothetical protein [Saccharothrix sp. HUAS TT1]|uniref:hypothetical protein n=1 Tax=unclassified Saccharothrix TaxID=2593673 RepID=UPI00345C3E22
MRKLMSGLARLLVLSTLVVALPSTASAAVRQPEPAPLTTPWTSQVSPTNALPEYPHAEEVGVAVNGDAHAYDSPTSSDADVSWAVAAPWTP